MSDITFNAKAYCKIILHAVKYPHCSINGVLLAKASQTKGKEIEFVDAVPLFHISLNLTPMAEVALMQIDEYASKNGLVIAGYYAALENFHDNSIEKAQHRISDKIAANFGPACLVVVDNKQLGLNLKSAALQVAQFSEGGFKKCSNERIGLKPSKAIHVCSRLMEKSAYNRLVDFDNHLDNVSLDWTNPGLNKEIESFL